MFDDKYVWTAQDLAKPRHVRHHPVRKTTKYIVLHTTEGEFEGSMRRLDHWGLCHFVIDTDGTIYRVMPSEHYADSAGESMWHGETDLSEVSIGIEIVGYYFNPLSDAQYKSLAPLVAELRKQYKVPESNVLGHYQVAANTNYWSRVLPLRGRRSDASNIDWRRIGVKHDTRDLDYEAGRVGYDDKFKVLMAGLEELQKKEPVAVETPTKVIAQVYGTVASNEILKGKTAWTVAGAAYNATTTYYVFPTGVIRSGDEFEDKEWDSIPPGTRVYMETTRRAVQVLAEPVVELAAGETVWSKIQSAYRDHDTCYVTPDSNVIRGDEFVPVPPKTKIVLGCAEVATLTLERGPMRVAGREYSSKLTLYLFPTGEVQTGERIKNWSGLPNGTRILTRKVG
ncbi:MAG: peptidoglycan recognition family protein [bacterium]